MKKALRICFMSIAVSFCLVFTLIIINAIMKIFIDLNYYLLIFALLSVGLSVGLILIDSKRIFTKSKLRRVSTSKNNVKKKQRRVNETRRKIS